MMAAFVCVLVFQCLLTLEGGAISNNPAIFPYKQINHYLNI